MAIFLRFVSTMIVLSGMVGIALGQGSQGSPVNVAQEHLNLLMAHQNFLEKMYWSAGLLIAAFAFVAAGLFTFFGVRTKSQIDSLVREHFAARVKTQLEQQFDQLSEEMIAAFDEKVREAAERVSDDLSGVSESLSRLDQEVNELKQAQTGERETTQRGVDEDVAWERMQYALLNHRFIWRSIERLALEARISPQDAEAILADHPSEVRISRGKSGRRIARHLTRAPTEPGRR